jgi:hypothetical protein
MASAQPEAAQLDPVALRARAIFKASEEVKPFNPAEFDFAMVDDDLALAAIAPATDSVVPKPVETPAAPKQHRKRYLGMQIWQLLVLGVLGLALCCIVAGFAYYFIAVA